MIINQKLNILNNIYKIYKNIFYFYSIKKSINKLTRIHHIQEKRYTIKTLDNIDETNDICTYIILKKLYDNKKNIDDYDYNKTILKILTNNWKKLDEKYKELKEKFGKKNITKNKIINILNQNNIEEFRYAEYIPN